MDRERGPSKYLWLDLEMTGLNVEKERVIEVAAVATDTDLNELSSYEAVVYQDQQLLEAMDNWNKEHHKKSGLLAKISNGKHEFQVESELIQWCKKVFKEERIVLAGNSISQDRLFIERYFKEFANLLHYRQLDVTSLKLIFLTKDIKFKKKNAHRALDDVYESIAEFKFYREHIKI